MADKSKVEAERLQDMGRKLQDLYDMGYVSPKRALGFAFLKGLASGVGVFIGGTLIITLLIWILGLFDQLPLLDGLIKSVRNSLNNN